MKLAINLYQRQARRRNRRARFSTFMFCLLILVLALACTANNNETPPRTANEPNTTMVTDARGANVEIKDASRIVSVGGSVTETIYALGAQGSLVGTDSSSLYPAEATQLPQVGYMRQLSSEGVLSLRPSLVLAAEDTGAPAALEQIRSAGVPLVIVPSQSTLDGARAKIRFIARALNREANGAELINRLEADLRTANEMLAGVKRKPRVLFIYARGAGALNVSGTGTAADEMIRLAGGVNAITGFANYKPLTPEAVVAAAPDIVLFPSRGLESVGGVEGALKLPGISETPAGRDRRIIAQDDLLLLGFGARTGEAVRELVNLIHKR